MLIRIRKGLMLPLLLFLSYSLGAQDLHQFTQQQRQNLRQGLYNKSIKALETEIQQIRRKQNSSLADPYGLECFSLLAEALIKDGQLDKALALLEEEAANDAVWLYPGVLEMKALLELNLGRAEQAEEWAQKSLDLMRKAEQEGGESYARGLSLLGNIYWNQGRMHEALSLQNAALTIRRKAKDSHDLDMAASYNDLGLLYLSENAEKALEYYEKALKIYQSHLEEPHPKIAIAYANIGLAHEALEGYFNAQSYFADALKNWEALHPKGHPNTAFNHVNLGRSQWNFENREGAKEQFEKALDLYQKAYGERHPELSSTYQLLSLLALEEGNYDQSIALLQKGLIANSSGFDQMDEEFNPGLDDFFNGQIFLNNLLYKSQALEARHYQKTLKFTELKMALETLEKADSLVNLIRQTRSHDKDKVALSELSEELYARAVRLCFAMSEVAFGGRKKYLEQAFYFAEKSKAAVLLDAISDTKAKAFAGIPQDILDEEQELKSQLAFLQQKLSSFHEEDKESIHSALVEARIAYKHFVQNLEKEYPEYHNLKFNQQIPKIDQLQNQLKGGEQIISYFIHEEAKRLFLFQLNQKKFDVYNEPLPDQFQQLISGFRNSIYFKEPSVFFQTGAPLYEHLFPKGSRKKGQNLIIIPHGRLAITPFEALLSQEFKGNNSSQATFSKAPFLVKENPISYAYNSSLWYQSRLKSREVGPEPRAILAAPIEFLYDDDVLPTLPSTKAEVEQISASLGSSGWKIESYLMDEATRKIIPRIQENRLGLLHLATHGLVNESRPELSRIYLSGEDVSQGSLFFGDLYNLQMDCALVSLSACQTGLGKVSRGEGVMGLSRALLYAGADNLLVSLWNVNDESTSRLMGHFYQNISQASSGLNYATSLQKAKLSLLDEGEKYANPYFWASFILIGQ